MTIEIVATCRVGLAVAGRPHVCVVCGFGVCLMLRMVNGQSHCYNGVTAIDSMQRHLLRSCSVEYDIVPSIRQLAFADSLVIGDIVCWVYRYGERGTGRTFVFIGDCNSICCCVFWIYSDASFGGIITPKV